MQKEYKHIQVINQENKGAAASRNVGLTNISGDVFMFIDADDIFLPGRIDLMANNFNIAILLITVSHQIYSTWQEYIIRIYKHKYIATYIS